MNEQPRSALAQTIDSSFKFGYVLMACMAIAWLSSGVTSVPADSQALVLRFGKVVHHQAQGGLVLALPFPFDEVVQVPGPERKLQLHVKDLNLLGKKQAGDRRGQLLTADKGLLGADLQINYHVSDPHLYALHTADIPTALQRHAHHALIHSCAQIPMDKWLITDRTYSQQHLLQTIQRKVIDAKLGIHVDRVDLEINVPHKAKVGFDQAQAALAEASSLIAQSKADATRIKRKGKADADKISRHAKAKAASIQAGAEQRIAPVAAWMDAGHDNVRDIAYHKQASKILSQIGRVLVIPKDDPLRYRSQVP